MAIVKRPQPVDPAPAAEPADRDAALMAFIAAAPDAKPTAAPAAQPKGLMKGKKRQITHTIDQDLLDRIDEMAKDQGMSRAAIINMGASQLLERGAIIQGRPKA